MKLLFVQGPAVVLSLALLFWVASAPAFPGRAAQEAQGQEPPAQNSTGEQTPAAPTPTVRSGSADRKEVRLPNGKLQREEILKDEYAQNIKDAQTLAELSQQLRDDLEKGNHAIFSVSDLRKTDEIERLVKKIRSRMRR